MRTRASPSGKARPFGAFGAFDGIECVENFLRGTERAGSDACSKDGGSPDDVQGVGVALTLAAIVVSGAEIGLRAVGLGALVTIMGRRKLRAMMARCTNPLGNFMLAVGSYHRPSGLQGQNREQQQCDEATHGRIISAGQNQRQARYLLTIDA